MNLLIPLETNIANTPDKLAFTFFETANCSDPALTLSYQAFIYNVYTVAQYFIERGATPGERALIVLPQSLDYLLAFYGCLYAQLIAVPLFPPNRPHHVQRIETVVNNADAKFIITDKTTMELLHSSHVLGNAKDFINYVDITACLSGTQKKDFAVPNIKETDIVYLQYTSGSTSDPRGVMVSHANLLANLAMQQRMLNSSAESVIVSWLPFAHDMGLIGAPISSLYLGSTAHLTTPLNFIKQPRIWLDAITNYHGTISWGPNFAYDMCVNEIHDIDRKNINLSSWQIAINASEPVRASTIDNFIAAYKRYGFNPKAAKNFYGLAEATLVVSGIEFNNNVYYETLDNELLQSQQVAQLAQSDTSLTIKNVSAGIASDNTKILIVDPQTKQALAARQIGEIWVYGPHVCKGYWDKDAINKEIFTAYTDSNFGPCLRTGDLGYINEKGDLFVVGRIKDIIIIRGKNYAAHDIEQTVGTASPHIRANFIAAFSVNKDDKELLIVVIEMKARLEKADAQNLILAAQTQLRNEHGIVADEIIISGTGAITRTTSGKLQRQLCKKKYLTKQLPMYEYAETTLAIEV